MTVVFLVIAYGGYTQSWTFSGKELGLPRPVLAGLFESIPYLWELWVLLIAPLVIPVQIIGAGELVATELWLFWTLQTLYFYVLTWLMAIGLKKLTRQRLVRNACLWRAFTG